MRFEDFLQSRDNSTGSLGVYKPMKNNCKNVDGNYNVKEKADTNSDLEICPKCGSKIRHGRRFCDHCGVKTEDSASD